MNRLHVGAADKEHRQTANYNGKNPHIGVQMHGRRHSLIKPCGRGTQGNPAFIIQNADQIVVMDDGKIAAVGTHEALLATCSIYREVFESQQKGESNP